MLFSAQSHEFTQTGKLCEWIISLRSVGETEGGSRQKKVKQDSDVQLREPFEPNTGLLITVRTEGQFLPRYVRKYILYRLKNTSVLASVISFSRARPTFSLRETLRLFRV